MIAKAEKLIDKMEEDAKERQKAGGKRGGESKGVVTLPQPCGEKTRDKLGKLANVSVVVTLPQQKAGQERGNQPGASPVTLPELVATSQIAESPTRTEQDGRTTNTSNIGKSNAAKALAAAIAELPAEREKT